MNDNRSAYQARDYDGHISSVLPFYREYHSQVIDLIKATGNPSPHWLDTGCGTGTLALRAGEEIPGAHFTLCDPSEKMLGEAREKLRGKDVTFLNLSSQELSFSRQFDVVTAIQCHHYLTLPQREEAIKRCYEALKESGIFITFENIRLSTEESDALGLRRWTGFLEDHGNPREEIERQLTRRGTEVRPITLEQHLALLKSCGFRSCDVLWASYLQAGFFAIR